MNRPTEPARRLAAVWFADIVGYTTLSSQDEDGAMQVVGAFQRLSQEIVPQYSGRIVKYVGDAALAEFASTDGAIRAALAFVERFVEDPAAKSRGMTIRIGVNVGEVISAPDGDIYGDGVNLASRLQNQADPGQVVASEAVHAQIRQRPVFRTHALGEKAVKGIENPIRIFAVSLLEPGVGGAVTLAPKPAASAPAPVAAPAGATRSRGKARWLVPAGVAGVLGVAAMLLLAAGDVAVARATYPVVEGGLQIGAPITVEFTGAIDRATATSRNIRLLDPKGRPVQAEVALGADERSVVLTPRAPLVYAGSYTLVVSDSLKSSRGMAVLGVGGREPGATLPIKTQGVPDDATRPRFEPAPGFDRDAVPASGPIRVRFSEAIDPESAPAGVRLTSPAGTEVQATLEVTDGNREVRLAPAAPLDAGERYVVRVDSTLVAATGLGAPRDSVVLRVAARRPEPGTGATPAGGGARPTTGTLNLTVVPPGAQPFLKLVVDGDTVRTLRGITLDERAHTVVLVGVPELSSFGLPVFRQSVTVQPGQVVNVSAQITPFGSIDVVSEPSGAVFIDGRQVGRTPLAGYPVTAGTAHRLEIRPSAADAARVGPYTAEFRVQPLEWKSLGRVTLPPREK
jgi:class 3 adenylate cyclase